MGAEDLAVAHSVGSSACHTELLGWCHRPFTGWSMYGSELPGWFSVSATQLLHSGWSPAQMKASCMLTTKRADPKMHFMVLIKVFICMQPKPLLFLSSIHQHDHFLTVLFLYDFFLQMEFWFSYQGR